MSKPQISQTFLPNRGQQADVPEEFLLNRFSPKSRNLEFYNQFLQGRGGLDKLDTTALSGEILNTFLFNKLDGTFYLMFFTPKDIYSYDFSETRFDILNPVYTTGTITIAAGTLNIVTGSGTSWSGELKAGDYIKIGSGGIHTDSTWYEIQSVDSDTQLTLTGNAVEATGSAYVARIIFNGSSTHYWDVERFVDGTSGEVAVATNNVDTPVYWTGSGQVAEVQNLPSGFTAKYVTVYSDRLVFLWTVEGGQNQPQRERRSDPADFTTWGASSFKDFMDEPSEITGVCKFAGYLVVFKEDCAYAGRWVGGSYVFDYERSTVAEGCKSHFSIIVRPEGIYYYARDSKFHLCNLVNKSTIISEGIFSDTREFDPNIDMFIFGYQVISKNQIRWFCPYQSASYNDYVFVWDHKEKIPEIWEYEQEQALCSIGHYVNTEDLYVDDPIWGEYYVDEQLGYWDDFSFLSSGHIIIYGGYDGYVRIADVGIYDDGEEYQRRFESSRDNFKKPGITKRLQRQQHWFEADISGDVTVKMRLDDKETDEALSHSISLVNSGSDKVKQNTTWDKYASSFKTIYEASNHFAMIGFLSRWYQKKKRL